MGGQICSHWGVGSKAGGWVGKCPPSLHVKKAMPFPIRAILPFPSLPSSCLTPLSPPLLTGGPWYKHHKQPSQPNIFCTNILLKWASPIEFECEYRIDKNSCHKSFIITLNIYLFVMVFLTCATMTCASYNYCNLAYWQQIHY
jgi:hypothetical protein